MFNLEFLAHYETTKSVMKILVHQSEERVVS